MREPKERVEREVVAETKHFALVRTTVTIESFLFKTNDGATIRWNITAAKEFVRASASVTVVEMERIHMAGVVQNNAWTEDGVEAADPSQPGIAAPIVMGDEIGYVLIDGIHRCVRAFRDGKPFSAALLTDEQNRACIIDAPPRLVP